MPTFNLNDSVIVSGRGPGVVTDIIGGPAGKLYRVSFTGPEHLFSTSYTTDASELTAAADIPTYAPGDIVLYQNRRAEVTAFDPDTGAVEIVADPPLPDPNPEVAIESRVVLAPWEIYLHQLKG